MLSAYSTVHESATLVEELSGEHEQSGPLPVAHNNLLYYTGIMYHGMSSFSVSLLLPDGQFKVKSRS